MQRIARMATALDSAITFQSTVGSAGFNLASYSGGTICCTATSSGSTITLTFVTRVNSGDSTTFDMADGSNALVTMTVQPNRAYPLPDALFACTWVSAKTASAGQTATCQIIVKT